MVQINFAQREINCKIVYYGPGLSGKTTTLEVIHQKAPDDHIGEMVSIATESDRTLYFDFLPLNLGTVAGMTTKFQIYTVPGQVYYNATRKLVLKGVDGVIFVADSQKDKMDENKESLANLAENLEEHGLNIEAIPLILQYNKRDLDNICTVEEMEQQLNERGVPAFESIANTGQGVFPALKALSKLVINKLNKEHASVRRGKTVPKASAPGTPPGPGGAPAAPKAPVPPGPPKQPAGGPQAGVAHGIPGPPQGTKPTGEVPVKQGASADSGTAQPPQQPSFPGTGVQTGDKVVIGGDSSIKKWIVIAVIVILGLCAALFGLYKVKPGILPDGIRKQLDSLMGGGSSSAGEEPATENTGKPASDE